MRKNHNNKMAIRLRLKEANYPMYNTDLLVDRIASLVASNRKLVLENQVLLSKIGANHEDFNSSPMQTAILSSGPTRNNHIINIIQVRTVAIQYLVYLGSI